MNKIRYLILILILFIFVGCTKEEPVEEPSVLPSNVTASYYADKTFSFRDFEVTVSSNVKIVTINKELSQDNNKKVVQVPVTVKNVGNSSDHISMFYYKFYNNSMTEISTKGSNFDDSLDYAGDLAPGQTYTKYFYFPYDGNGKYYIEFNTFSKKNYLILDINK
jgi:hypothetical protein